MKLLESEKKEKQLWLRHFGAHVRKMRLRKGLTGGELARQLNIDKSNLIRIEKGRVNTSVYMIRQICNVLEINMKDFWKEFNEK